MRLLLLLFIFLYTSVSTALFAGTPYCLVNFTNWTDTTIRSCEKMALFVKISSISPRCRELQFSSKTITDPAFNSYHFKLKV